MEEFSDMEGDTYQVIRRLLPGGRKRIPGWLFSWCMRPPGALFIHQNAVKPAAIYGSICSSKETENYDKKADREEEDPTEKRKEYAAGGKRTAAKEHHE